MGLLKSFMDNICVPLDGLLWRNNINHPHIRPLLRNEILACGACLIIGGAVYIVFPWLFWFGAGIGCILWIFWSWAKFFASFSPENVLIASILWRFWARLLLLAIVLYFALAWFGASATAILAGIVSGSILGLASFAWSWARKEKR